MEQETPTTTSTSKHRVAANGVWMMVNSVASRAAGFVAQFTLAWILVPEQFGLIAIANSMAILVDLVSQFGLSDVLVCRYRKFHLWRPAGYTLSLILGLGATGIMLLLAIGAGYVDSDRDLGWVIAIMAIAAPIRAMTIVHYSQLRAEMQFRPIAIVQSLGALTNMVVVILLALLGFGVYSFAWARVADAIVRTLGWLRFAKSRQLLRFSLRGAKYLIKDSIHGYTTSFCNNIVQQSDYLILALFVVKEEVGGYSFAFMISVQAISLIAINLTAVLFPAFSALAHAPDRQIISFIRSAKMLAFICAPICVLQALVAAPLIPLILEPEWHGIVPLVQIMSIGTALRCASFSWHALLKAQGRFSTVAFFSAIMAAIFPCVIAFSCYLGGVWGCAVGASIYYAVVSPLQLAVAIQSERNKARQVLDLCLRPLIIAGVAFGIAGLLATPARTAGMPILEMAIDAVVGFALYWGLSWMLNPLPTNDSKKIVHQVRDRLVALTTRTSRKAT